MEWDAFAICAMHVAYRRVQWGSAARLRAGGCARRAWCGAMVAMMLVAMLRSKVAAVRKRQPELAMHNRQQRLANAQREQHQQREGSAVMAQA